MVSDWFPSVMDLISAFKRCSRSLSIASSCSISSLFVT